MKFTLAIAIALLMTVSVFAQSVKDSFEISRDIDKVLEDQVAAWNAGDIEGFMKGYWKSDEMRFVSGNSISMGWQAALDRYKRNYDTREKMGTLTFSESIVTVLDKNNAYVFGRWTLKRTNDEPTGLFTLIFRRTDDGWKITHDHTSS
ncbi:MAG: nuclear transport factor 2 family protein [Acidobacteria bacterium]|nr:MAG: nuclear transport factor 2 family protein [Acidobacteriota bacterium]REJ98916.1 MAG: nuclear transport factor 2 family protein [Acidobacteriota bacterium]REK16365.1 MAG: nuclear transport factor 2 family protein [Acidobacteriota bacterium]REK44046.1 MAG: nuclear transport factor 2 family protein [Acidobacteriota bacterium]